MKERYLYILLIIAMFLWGTSWPTSKILTAYASAAVITFWRFLFVFLGSFLMLYLLRMPFKIPLNILYRNLYWFYQELYFLNKKVISIILPLQHTNYKLINAPHKKLCAQFGFNFINMQEYYEKYQLEEFGKRIDANHQQQNIMREFGKNIIKNIDNFKKPRKLNIENDNPKFTICTPKDMKVLSGELQEISIKNSMYDELAFRLDENTKLQFPSQFKNFTLIATHTWNTYKPKEIQLNFADSLKNYSNFKLSNKEIKLSKECNFLNSVLEIHNNFIIDDETIVRKYSK